MIIIDHYHFLKNWIYIYIYYVGFENVVCKDFFLIFHYNFFNYISISPNTKKFNTFKPI